MHFYVVAITGFEMESPPFNDNHGLSLCIWTLADGRRLCTAVNKVATDHYFQALGEGKQVYWHEVSSVVGPYRELDQPLDAK